MINKLLLLKTFSKGLTNTGIVSIALSGKDRSNIVDTVASIQFSRQKCAFGLIYAATEYH